MKYGFIKVATAIPEVKIADTKFNLEAIEKQIVMAEGQGVEIIVFPEFCHYNSRHSCMCRSAVAQLCCCGSARKDNRYRAKDIPAELC